MPACVLYAISSLPISGEMSAEKYSHAPSCSAGPMSLLHPPLHTSSCVTLLDTVLNRMSSRPREPALALMVTSDGPPATATHEREVGSLPRGPAPTKATVAVGATPSHAYSSVRPVATARAEKNRLGRGGRAGVGGE